METISTTAQIMANPLENNIKEFLTLNGEDINREGLKDTPKRIAKMWDELLKPPSVDEQVEDFIKQFFEDEDEPLEQKDFLAEFFDELEENDDDKDNYIEELKDEEEEEQRPV